MFCEAFLIVSKFTFHHLQYLVNKILSDAIKDQMSYERL